MAYGVKYRLEFTDNELNDKKIEILKNGYTGSVLSLVGTSNPCIIDWSTDDNFYSPIKGSTCTLNLFETDDTNYDDFYAADEREYQLKVFYKDSSDVYQLFWMGYIVVDQFQEAVLTKPNQLTLKAFDGLGTLKKYYYPIDKTQLASKTYIYVIANILDNLDLDLDIYTSNDIRQYSPSGTTYSLYDELGASVTGVQDGWFKNGLALMDAKAVLENILRFTNSRIFQSLGRWYVISNSNYSENSLQSSVASTTSSTGTPPSNMRASETTYLQENATEKPRFVKYDNAGAYDSVITNENVLKVLAGPTTSLQTTASTPAAINVDLINLGSDLVKEYIRPVNDVTLEINLKQNNNNKIQNAGFEYDTLSWSTSSITGSGAIATDIVFQGLQSYKTTGTTSFANQLNPDTIIHQTRSVFYNASKKYKLKFRYYNDDTGSTGTKNFMIIVYLEGTDVPNSITISRYLVNSGTIDEPTYSWSDESSVTPISITIDENNSWNEVELDVPMIPSAFTSGYAPEVKITLCEPYIQTSTNYNAFYYDNVEFYEIGADGEDLFTPSDSVVMTRTQSGSNNFSGTIETKDIVQSNEMQRYQYFKGKIQGDFKRSRENHANLKQSLDRIITQEILNDYRTYVIRYSGTLYNQSSNKVPLSMHNKVWVNYGSSVLQEPVSAYIDGMSYNVKENTFEVEMHTPNQDNDVASTFKITYSE